MCILMMTSQCARNGVIDDIACILIFLNWHIVMPRNVHYGPEGLENKAYSEETKMASSKILDPSATSTVLYCKSQASRFRATRSISSSSRKALCAITNLSILLLEKGREREKKNGNVRNANRN